MTLQKKGRDQSVKENSESKVQNSKVKHRNYTIVNGVRHYWYCVKGHTHALFPALRFKCQEKKCNCFHCGREKK